MCLFRCYHILHGKGFYAQTYVGNAGINNLTLIISAGLLKRLKDFKKGGKHRVT